MMRRPFVLILAATALCVVAAAAAAPSPPQPAASFSGRFAPAESLAAQGRFEQMQAFLDSALAGARRHGPTALLLEALLRHGGSLAFIGRMEVGEPELNEAIALARAQRDTLAECRALNWLAYGFTERGRTRGARRINQRLAALARRIPNHQLEGRALTGLAFDDLSRGRALQARAGYRRAVALLHRAGDVTVELVALVGLGRAESQLGDARAARACWVQVVSRGTTQGLGRSVADAFNNLGSLEYEQGDAAAAVEHWTRSIKLYPGLGGLSGSNVPLSNLALALAELGRTDEAERILDQLAARDAFGRAFAQERRAAIRLNQGRPIEATRICNQLLAAGDSLSALLAIDVRLRIAEACLRQGQPAGAIAQLDTIALRHGANVPADQASEAQLVRGEAVLDLGRPSEALATLADAARRARVQHWSSNQLTALRDAAKCERALGRKARALARLREASDAWERWRADSHDPGWREARGSAARLLAQATAEALLEPPPGARAPSVVAVRAAFDALQRFKARTLEERARGPSAPVLPTSPLTAAELQQRVLRYGELLLDVHAGPDTTFVFALTRESLMVWGLPGDDIVGPRVERLRALVAERPTTNLDAAATDTARAALGAMLLGPARASVARATRILVAPDGALAAVPLGALLVPADRGGFVLPAREVAEVPSAASLARLRGPSTRRAPTRRILELGPTGDDLRLALPGAERELGWIAARFAGVERRPRGPSDGIAAVAASMPQYDLVHVATHESTDARRPWDSALLLGPLGAAEAERWLRASAIAVRPLAARLCVLSCCTSLADRPLAAEGIEGMAAAFLCAGVPSVVATLWPVDDELTASFMRDFYGSLARGRTAAAALAAAQSAARAGKDTRHPYYWAGFVLVGEPATRVDLALRRSAVSRR